MKKSTRKVLLGAATLAAVSAVSQGAYAAKDNLTINAKILRAVQITATQALDFGSLYETGAGTLKVESDGTVTPSASITVVGANAQQGQFTVKGGKGAVLEVTLPATAKITAGTKKMTVGAFTISSAPAAAATPFVITIGATVTEATGIKVGGTLSVAAGQATGTYTGSAVLTALYQ